MSAPGGTWAATTPMASGACEQIMTAGLVVGDGNGLDDAVTALRPYPSVLVGAAD
jgi:hypothetical protein